MIEVASDGKQQHNESLFQSIPCKTAVFEVAFFFRSHSACQIVSFAFVFIQSQEEAFVTILTPVKKCKKNGKLLDVDKYLSFTFYNVANANNFMRTTQKSAKRLMGYWSPIGLKPLRFLSHSSF